jgi:putative flippase GtrA
MSRFPQRRSADAAPAWYAKRNMASSGPPTMIERLMRPLRANPVALKALSFGVIGVINSAVDFSVFALSYYYFGLSILAAQITAWVIAVTGSYVMNSMITFAAESGGKLGARAFGAFVVAQVAGFLANTATVLLFSLVIPVWAAKLLAIGASFAVNFTLSHFVVFRRR